MSKVAEEDGAFKRPLSFPMAPRARPSTRACRSLELAQDCQALIAPLKIVSLGRSLWVIPGRQPAAIGPANPRTQPSPAARGAESHERSRLGGLRPLTGRVGPAARGGLQGQAAACNAPPRPVVGHRSRPKHPARLDSRRWRLAGQCPSGRAVRRHGVAQPGSGLPARRSSYSADAEARCLRRGKLRPMPAKTDAMCRGIAPIGASLHANCLQPH